MKQAKDHTRYKLTLYLRRESLLLPRLSGKWGTVQVHRAMYKPDLISKVYLQIQKCCSSEQDKELS